MDKEHMKSEITKLIERYNREKSKRYNEEATKNDFILPLFRILGWNTEDSNEVSKEENISGKRVDYGFRIDGIPKFFLEAKGLDEDLEGSRMVKGRQVTYAEQAINYAYYKGCNWAILTNFKGIIVYDAWAKSSQSSFRFAIWADSLLNDFDNNLYLLSREAFEQGLLDKKYSTKSRKRPITEQLLLDFTNFRAILSKDVYALNKSKNLTEEELDEAIQRLFDRLIFVRNCEDRELEPNDLLSLLRQWKENRKGTLVSKLRELFVHFDETYNSKIFSKHLCDQVDISDNALCRILDGLYTTEDGSIQYDFSLIDADILGNIYEQYLGHILKKTEKRTKLTESKAKRKAEGIYYTPSYIVDYIVRNTVGELVKNKKVDVSKIKVLDPACGSGSFLIKTFDVLNEYYSKKEGYNQNKLDTSGTGTIYSTKLSILKDNIFGVDLDKQAVDIAQLNLLLKVAEKKRRLPILQQNIKNGNSLIGDPNFAGDKAFKWDEEFKEIMDNGGFDVVVGNPPYVKARDAKDIKTRKFIEESEEYETPYKMWDLYIAFVERGIKLLKPNGLFAMIIPDTIGEADYTKKLTEMIVKNYSLYQIDFFPNIAVFSEVGVRSKIIFVKNTKTNKKCKRFIHEGKVEDVKLLDIIENPDFNTFRLNSLKIKVDLKNTVPLGNICYVSYGARFNSDKSDPVKFRKSDLISSVKDATHTHRYTEGKYLKKYLIAKELFVEWGTDRCPKKLVRPTFKELYPPEKLLMSRQKRISAISDEGQICDNTIIVGVPYASLENINNSNINKYFSNTRQNRKEVETISLKFDLKYLLAILNSKLVRYLLKIESRSKIDSYPDDWKKVPIKELSKTEQKKIISLVEKTLFLNKTRNQLGNKSTDERLQINEDIIKTDEAIDDVIYKIYGITEDEKKVIEESLK